MLTLERLEITHFTKNKSTISKNMRKIKVKYIIAYLAMFFHGMVVCQNTLTVSSLTGEGQYTDLQLAINSAQPNDIILVYSGSYGNITIDRPLSIYGPGYRIPENPSLQISTFRLNAFVNTITFLASSSGSLISGFYADKFIINNASNILIKRNYFYHQGIGYNSTMSNCSALVLEGNNFYISHIL